MTGRLLPAPPRCNGNPEGRRTPSRTPGGAIPGEGPGRSPPTPLRVTPGAPRRLPGSAGCPLGPLCRPRRSRPAATSGSAAGRTPPGALLLPSPPVSPPQAPQPPTHGGRARLRHGAASLPSALPAPLHGAAPPLLRHIRAARPAPPGASRARSARLRYGHVGAGGPGTAPWDRAAPLQPGPVKAQRYRAAPFRPRGTGQSHYSPAPWYRGAPLPPSPVTAPWSQRGAEQPRLLPRGTGQPRALPRPVVTATQPPPLGAAPAVQEQLPVQPGLQARGGLPRG